MAANSDNTNPLRSGAIDWLIRVNGQVSQWASSMSWGRLIVLFLVILIAGLLIEDLLHLKHDRVRVAGPRKEMAVTIGGPNGIRITTVPPASSSPTESPPEPPGPPEPAVPGAVQERGAGSNPAAAGDSIARAAAGGAAANSDPQTDDDDERWVSRQVITFRGILGDLGGVVLVVLFAYLAASKIVVRKVAQADAKVRTAVDAAEREAMERRLMQARLQVLQAQVEPHFLFNTLAAVDYLIETEPPRASQMQKALITYLRGALPQMREESSTLGREMRLIRSYLDLIKMRIEDRLQIEIAVPSSLENAEFPPMMLQSLVENAVKHGIEPKTEGGRIRVAAGATGTQLWVEVSDTGVGVPDGDLFDVPTAGTGIGLQNIRERLSMLYPGKSGLMLRSDPTTGTVVKISVPLHLALPGEESQRAAFTAGRAA